MNHIGYLLAAIIFWIGCTSITYICVSLSNASLNMTKWSDLSQYVLGAASFFYAVVFFFTAMSCIADAAKAAKNLN